MTYEETLQWMFDRFPAYQQQGTTAINYNLDEIIAFSKHLGHPEQQFKSIHVAGTNGKGSVSHMLASVLQEAGYKTGLYTSPHLKDFRERIRINGIPVEQQFVIDFIARHNHFLEARWLSFFEITTAMAFDYFALQRVDIAVFETGLGGRLDATNILMPEASVITNISYDHMHMLGDTLVEIAGEKAGIIKPGVPVVLSEYQEDSFPVFKEVATKQNAPLILADDLYTETYTSDLKGEYQAKNIKGVVAALKQLKGFTINETQLKKGLFHVVKNTGLTGRWQQLWKHPRVICDTAHNAAGLKLVFNQLKKEKFNHLHMVFGMVKGKSIADTFSIVPKTARWYFCSPEISRGLPAADLQQNAREYGIKGEVYDSVSAAYKAALKKAFPDDLIYIGGSTFVVAEVL